MISSLQRNFPFKCDIDAQISYPFTYFLSSLLNIAFILQCLDCSNTYCTGCLLKDNQGLLETNKCNQCSKNKMKSLEDLCKSVVRMSIATKGADMHSKSQGPSPTAYINQMVAKLNLPIIIKESLLIQD